MVNQIVWLLFAFLVAVLLLMIATKVRKLVWLSSTFKGIWPKNKKLKSCIRYINEHWGTVLLLEILAFLLYVIFTTVFVFGQDKLLAGIVIATPLTIFMIFQLPRLLKPHIYVTFLPPDDEGVKTQLNDMEKPLSSISLLTSRKHTLHFYISNLGINLYENWNFIVSSIHSNVKISNVPGSLSPQHSIEPRGNAAMHNADVSFPYSPNDNLMLDFDVETPKEAGIYSIIASFKCSTRWGETQKEMTLDVKEQT